MDIDKLFDGMAKAPINGRGTFLTPGLYTVKLKNIFVKEGFKGKSFITEFEIVTSNNDEHKPGSTRSWVLNFGKAQTFPDITKFMMACLGEDPAVKANQDDAGLKALAELFARAVCGSDTAPKELGEDYRPGMFEGRELKLECTPYVTKAGTDFTVHAWSPLP